MRSRLSLVVTGVLILTLSMPLLAQQGTSSIRGRVVAAQGDALPGVTVVVKNEQTGMYRETVSDKDGIYVISGVTPGSYELTAELSGFNTYRRHDIRLEVGKAVTLDVPMKIGAVAEEVTVTAAAPLVDVTSKEVGGNITSKELVELPSINRNFIGFVGLLPGVVPNISTESFGSDSVSVNGQDPRNNNYLVDGGNNNDDVIGQRAGTQARTPLESIQEFQVLTGQYDAEFGRTTGGIINAVTKQGTNNFKGVAFAFLQDAQFTEKDFFAKQLNRPKPDTRFFQWGGNIGGPIIRDRLHFFANVERVENDRPNALVLAARPEIVEPTTLDRVWNTMIRVDQQFSSRMHAAARWLRESSPQTNQIIGNVTPAAAREESDVDQTAVGSFDMVFGNSKLNTTRFTWTQENVAFANPGFNGNGRRQDLLPPTLVFQSYTDQQSAVAQARVNDAYQLNDVFNWYVNNHDLRVGGEYERITEFFTDQGNMNGTFTFGTSNVPFNAADPRTYPDRFSIRVPGPVDLNIKVKYWNLFAQDKWSLSDRATLSLGLRYDYEDLPIDESDNPLFTNPHDYPTDSNNIAPRIGLSYALDSDKHTVLRGGVGRFYDKTHLELIQGVVTAGVFSSSFIVPFPTNAADQGPRNGRMPTDPFLVNGPVVNHDLIRQMFAPGARIKNIGTVLLDSPDRVVPYTDQISLGIGRQLTPHLAVNFDYVHADGRDQFMSRELNQGSRATPALTSPVTRPNADFRGSVLERVNTGRTKYDAFEFQLDHHLGKNYQYRVSYTYSKSRGNTSGNGIPTSDLQVGNDMNLDENEGPTDFDKPHNLSISGSWRVPHTGGLVLSTVTRYVSGSPFTVEDRSVDPNKNGILFDPLPAGRYSGTGRNSISVSSDGGRNGARGPDFFEMDMRAGYELPVVGSQVQLFVEMFNVTNRANFANPPGNRLTNLTTGNPAANFLVLNALKDGAAPRTLQFGVRMQY